MTQEIETKVIDAAEAVQYSPGSVVSKQIIKKKTGTITLFAFDAGESLSEHTAPYDAYLQVVEGTAEITIAGNSCTVGTNSYVILPANIPHAVNALEKFKMLLVMIKEIENK